MTAEIAVYNKSAIALAADSAVTISDGSSSKIYNGAEKLFALSKYQPLGIMLYGAGSLCSIPWELIIKQYRKSLGKESFQTLDAYAEDFWSYLSNAQRLVPKDLRYSFLDSSYNRAIQHVITMVDGIFKREIELDNSFQITTDLTMQTFLRCSAEIIIELQEADFFSGFDSHDLVEAEVYASLFLERNLSSLFPDIDFPDANISSFKRLLALITCKDNQLGLITGVVFAGYGSEEYFPVVLAYNVHGFFGNKLRFTQNLEKSSAAGNSGMTAYAQEEEVFAFEYGANPRLLNIINEKFRTMLGDSLTEFEKIVGTLTNDNDLKKRLVVEFTSFTEKNWQRNVNSVNDFIRVEHCDKVTQMIEFLPKDELAYMAESLVNMTAFKRKVSNDAESVGGPIDVAIISKGDGFIWVKRKHYFSKELNSHYFNEFLRG
ncbi:hypothetical protein [Vibrio navarrensis]|uniref:Uncharacterized protein n=1 Tax=Vibrio navarrensis TaxID=29495 RepID=A0AAJ4LTE8_9VIBR|nr:hypothetical protein I3X05_10425 [Vibrio navarrensis]